MRAVDLRQETYLPEEGAEKELATVFDFLRAHEVVRNGPVAERYLLIGTNVGEQVELPPRVYKVLLQVVEAMSRGLAVTVMPSQQSLTTQQAAELLGITRPTLVRLLEQGKIPFDRAGNHRKVLLRDLLEYREQRRQDQYAALEATSVPIEEEDDIKVTLESLREIRGELAAKRRRSR